MERQNIYNAYKQINPGEDSRAKMLDNILARASEISPTGKDANMKHIHTRSVLIAAIVIIMLVTMGAAVVHLRVADLHMGEYVKPEHTYTNSEGTVVTVPEVTLDRISLQGIKDSPNSKAVQEWLEFYDSYDHDYKLLHEADDNGFVCPEAYHAYDVYTQEMIAKVDEIAEKYGLKLVGPVIVACQSWEMDEFFDTIGIDQFHREAANADVTHYYGGHAYECGSFKVDFDIESHESGNTFSCSMRYSNKEYFDAVYFVDDIDAMEQRNYKTADGTDVLIISGIDYTRILCDRDDAFISVYISPYVASTNSFRPLTQEEADFIADSLDFSIKPQV